MVKTERFTFVCNAQERALIIKLAERLQRSQSDAVRFVLINAAKELEALPQGEINQIKGVTNELLQ